MYLEGKISKEEMIEKLKMETRRYAKRQLTWFRRIENLEWLNYSNSLNENLDIIINKSNI